MQIPKAQKDSQVISVFFVLLGSGSVKFPCKMLVISTPGVDFVIILHTYFLYVFCVAFLLLKFGFVIFWWKIIGEKAACKMLMIQKDHKLFSATYILYCKKSAIKR